MKKIGSSLVLALLCVLCPLALVAAASSGTAAAGEVVALVDRWQPVLDVAFANLSAAATPAVAVVALDALSGHGLALRAEVLQLLGRWPELRRAQKIPGLYPVFARVWSAAGRYDGIVRAASARHGETPAVAERIRRLRSLAGR